MARGKDDQILLGLMASDRSGYVRAEAVRLMGAAWFGRFLPFLMVRLTDWVDEVRECAERQFFLCLQPAFAESFVDCLDLLDRLSLGVEQLLKSTECATALCRGLTMPSRGIGRHCFRLAAENPGIDASPLVLQAIADRDVLVRKWAYIAGVAPGGARHVDSAGRQRLVWTHSPDRL